MAPKCAEISVISNTIEENPYFSIADAKKKYFSFQIAGETAGTQLQLESESFI